MDSAEDVASALVGMDSFALLEAGVDARNRGQAELAHVLLTAAHVGAPSNWQAPYELGLLQERNKNSASALQLFEDSYSKNQTVPRLVERLAVRLALGGHFNRVAAVLDDFAVSGPSDSKELNAVLADFSRFVRSNPLNEIRLEYWEAIGRPDSRKKRGSHRVLTVSSLVEEIRDSISERNPFAMLRLGDGEGTWLHYSEKDELRYGNLFSRNRDEFWNTWYGDASTEYRGQFSEASTWISGNLCEADVIGIPSLSWIEHEWMTGSLRGYSGTLNAFRAAKNASTDETKYAAQTIHFELDQHDWMSRILGGQDRVGVLSCHPGIADVIREKFGVQEVVYIPVPGEPSRRHLLGEDAVYGVHFPDRYMEIINEIEASDFEGVPFLVAGGILGKSYALRLKRAGAIALDIGSIADKWMKKRTRPQFDDSVLG